MSLGATFSCDARFRVIRKLGEGGMGAVFEAEDRERGERVALKTLHRRGGASLLRFKQEFRALQDIEHPNLIRLGELLEADGHWMFSMELVSGVDLLQYIRQSIGPLADAPTEVASLGAVATGAGARRASRPLPTLPAYDEARLRASFQQLAEAIATLHDAQLVHRDIKPSNILVESDGRVVLLDFGLVTDTGDTRQSTDLNIVGTAAYMAPEQAAAGAVGPAADWYAVGVVLYEALTGRLPYGGRTMELLLAKQTHAPAPPRAIVPAIPTDLDELCTQLLAFDPTERPGGEEILRRLGVAPASRPPSLTTMSQLSEDGAFIGRNDELAALDGAFDAVTRGEPSTVFVHGPSGMGKSALVGHFFDELEARGEAVTILRGRCYERESVPFKALDGVVDALSRLLQRMSPVERASLVPRRAGLLPAIFPVLERVDAIAAAPRPARTDPVVERRWAFIALRELLAALGDRQPLIISIDDMQWSDLDSYELIHALLSGEDDDSPGLPALLVLGSRDSELGRPTTDGRRTPWPGRVQAIEVGRLTHDETCQLATLLLARDGTDASADALAREADGHPLFVAELVRFAAHAALDHRTSPSLDAAIAQRAGELAPPARRVLDLLATASVPLSVSLIERALGLNANELARQLAVLRVSAFARTVGSRPEVRAEPFHDRVREAILGVLAPDTRRDLHRRLGLALAAEPLADPELVADHLSAAGDASRAAEKYEEAAARAVASLAFERAAAIYRRVLQLRDPEPAERSSLNTSIGDALAHAGLRREAARAYQAALDGATEAESLRLRALIANHLLLGGEIPDGLTELENVLHAVDLALPRTHGAAILSFVAQFALLRLRGDRIVLRDESDVTLRQRLRVDALEAATKGLGWVDGVLTAPLAVRWLREALAVGDRDRLIHAFSGAACLLSIDVRQPKYVAHLLQRLRELVEPVSDSPYYRGIVLGAEAMVAQNEGRFADNYTAATEAVRLLATEGHGRPYWEQATAEIFALWGMAMTGRYAQFTVAANEMRRQVEARGDRWYASLCQLLTASYVALAHGEPDDALDLCNRGIEPWRDRPFSFIHYNWLVTSSQVLLYLDDDDEALALIERHWRDLRRSGSLRVPVLLGYVLVARARTHLARWRRTRNPSDLRMVARDTRALRRNKLEPFRAVSWLFTAQLLIARGHRERALSALDRAIPSLERGQLLGNLQGARWLRGVVVGGDEGKQLETEARAYFAAEGIVEPERFAPLFGVNIALARDLS